MASLRLRCERARSRLALGLLLSFGSTPLAAEAPVPPSPPEGAAAAVLLDWMVRGAPAVREALAADCDLAGLPVLAAEMEIEARLGSPEAEGVWELQGLPWASEPLAAFRVVRASGLDEAVVFEMREVAGEWKVCRIGHWGESWRPPAGGDAGALVSSSPHRDLIPAGTIALLVGLSLVLSGTGRARRLTVGVVAATVLWSCRDAAPPTSAPVESGPPRLASVLPVRDALDADLPRTEIEKRVAAIRAGAARDLAERWLAELDVLAGELDRATERLDAVPNETALDAILRGRVALQRGDGARAEEAWDEAAQRFPAIDGLRLELAAALVMLGGETGSRVILEGLTSSGTRLAEAWYAVARIAAIDGRDADGVEAFTTAWALLPMERAEIVRDVVNAYLAGEAELVEALALGPSREPARGSTLTPPEGREPFVVASGVELATTGELLRARHGVTELLLPGAACFAPPGTVVEDPAARGRHLEARALEDIAAARLDLSSAAILSSPILREKVAVASFALARRGEWSRLIELTAGLETAKSAPPPTLGRLRAAALARAGQLDAARAMLVRIAGDAVANRRRDPVLFLQIADLLLDLGEFDYAERAANIAESQLAFAQLEPMAPRIAMERRLAGDFGTVRTDHFLLRHPKEASAPVVEAMGALLEAELEELRPWLSWRPPEADPIEVHLLWFDDFLRHYSIGGTAIASYDGALRLPFAAVRRIPPQVHEILTHELVHALLDGATNGRAPAWYHEGLAQHLEPVQHGSNPIPDYTSRERRIALPLVEAVFSGRPRPDLVSVAYDEALWAVRHLEARWGRDGLVRYTTALRDGDDPEAALQQAFGMGIAELDEATWKWALEEVPRGRWKPRRSRNIEEWRPPPPKREEAASVARLGGGADYFDKASQTHLVAEAAKTVAWQRTFESGLLDAARGLVAWRRARSANDGPEMEAACEAIAAATLPALAPARSDGERMLAFRAEKVLRLVDETQRACRRSDWSGVDLRVTAAEQLIGEMQKHAADAARLASQHK